MMRMNNLKIYDVKFVGLKNGSHTYTFKIDNTFFEIFEFNEFNHSNIVATVNLLKSESMLTFSIHTQGTVNIPCDISGEKYDQEVVGDLEFIIKFGETFNDDNDSLIIVNYNTHTFNIAQQIYETVVSLYVKQVKDSFCKYVLSR